MCDHINATVDQLRAQLLDVSHSIHAHPEVRFTEHHAARLLTDVFRGHGFDVTEGVANLKTAFTAAFTNPTVQAGDQVPTVAIFLEYDALEGLGHGCGHNTIAAAGLGAVLAIKQWLSEQPDVAGKVIAVGSPAEEGGGGKAYLIDAGTLSDVDVAMMVHPMGENVVAMRSLAREAMEFVFTGHPAHAAATPHEGRNALDAATLTLNAIGLLRQQILPDSRIHSIITEGGQAPNIIPERASITTFVRSPDTDYLTRQLVPAVENCAHGAALATGTQVEIVKPTPAYAGMRTNDILAQLLDDNLHRLGREPDAPNDGGAAGSTDMGNVSQVVASAHPCLRLTPGIPMHTHQAAEAAGSETGDQVVIDGAKLLAATTVQLFTHPELFTAAAASFAEGH